LVLSQYIFYEHVLFQWFIMLSKSKSPSKSACTLHLGALLCKVFWD
jgi:hypothetical protein